MSFNSELNISNQALDHTNPSTAKMDYKPAALTVHNRWWAQDILYAVWHHTFFAVKRNNHFCESAKSDLFTHYK